MMGVALLTKVPVYYAFGLYRRLWVYASTSELRLITVAVTAASVVTSGVMLLLHQFWLGCAWYAALCAGHRLAALAGSDWRFAFCLANFIGTVCHRS